MHAFRRVLRLPCPLCGSPSAAIRDEGTAFACESCGEDITPEDVRDIITAWTPVLASLEADPVQS